MAKLNEYFGVFMKEDLELDAFPSKIPDEVYNYVKKSTHRGEDFWLVYTDDLNGLEKILGVDNSEELESILDDIFEYNWGYSDSWDTCYRCGEAVFLDDVYSYDYWVDYEGGAIYCSDCIKEDMEVTEAYLDYLENNPDVCNMFLTDSELENAGLFKLDNSYACGYYGRRDNPKDILDALLIKYPHGRFIFNLNDKNRFEVSYDVWSFPM